MKRRAFIRTAGVLSGTAVAGKLAVGGDLSLEALFPDARPNVLLILTDQQSADAMSCRMGNRFINTPAIDSLASRGVSFARAYTPNPLCVPARTSLFTGHYPHVTGVQTNTDINKSISGQYRCLGAYFRDAGYDTGYVGKWHQPFRTEESSVHGFQSLGPVKNNGVDKDIPPFAKEFIGRKRDVPFFLVTSFVNPHNICEWARGEELKDGAVGDPPAVEECPPAVGNLAPVKDETDTMLLMRRSFQANRLFPVGNFDEKKWREYRWAYFRMIEKVDAYIATILEELHKSGQLGKTLVVFTSDHGDMQGGHGWNQKTVFYDNSSRVPFIVSAPGMQKGSVSNRLVNTGIDLLPTLCDYAGINVPTTLPGTSLRPSVMKPEGPDPRTYIVVQNKMIQGTPIDGVTPEPAGRMVRSARFMYCAYDLGTSRESLVDLQNDPGETVNLARDERYRKDLEQHRGYLAEWCRANGDTFVVPE
jgi:arylsulfatase A-like enzyme